MRNPPQARRRLAWRSQAFRAVVYQLLAVAVVLALLAYLVHNTSVNMQQRGIQSGFDFLNGAAGFDIGESLLPYDSGDSYWKAYLVGVSNTLRVAVLAAPEAVPEQPVDVVFTVKDDTGATTAIHKDHFFPR